MNIVDMIIIIFLLFGIMIGFKRGFMKQLFCSIGFFLILIISFYLKNPVSTFLYQHFPFFQFTGVLKGITSLNIIIYEILAFLILFSILTILYRILLFATSVFEKFLSLTIILGIPSKILGAILGLLEHFIIVFILLYIFSFPIFQIDLINQSKWKDPILQNTPILSNVIKDRMKWIEEFKKLKQKHENTSNQEEWNADVINLLLKYHIVTIDSIDHLKDHQKMNIDYNHPVLKKYRNEG